MPIAIDKPNPINEIEIVNDVWNEIDTKTKMKDKLEHLQNAYNLIQEENKSYANTHKGLRIPELSRLSGALLQSIGKTQRELKTLEPEITHTIIIG